MFSIPNPYKGNYKLLAIYPAILIILSLIFIPNIKLGVDFTGGTLISLDLNQKVDPAILKEKFAADGLSGNIRIYDSAIGPKAEIELSQSQDLVKAEELKSEFGKQLEKTTMAEVILNQNASAMEDYLKERTALNKIANQMFALSRSSLKAEDISNLNTLQKDFGDSYSLVFTNYMNDLSTVINKHVSYSSMSVKVISPVLGTHFIEKAEMVVIFAAILSTIFVFLFIRAVIPSFAVITGAASDIIIALGAMGLFGIPLTLPSFAALLMLIGFSLDTDILLTMRMLKRKGNPREKAFDAMKTGLTMSAMAIVSFGILFILGSLTHISTYYEISAVALAGLVADTFATWGVNAVIILWYVERHTGIVHSDKPGDS
ncbi:MAG: hypothetical protein WCT31_03865 [Candidatus Micrarchaeia archaeon]|jgi:preprotein translocase subunit SecF